MSNKIIAEDFTLKKENKEDFKKSIIARHNLTNEFTLADIEEHKHTLAKMEREAKAQIRVSTAAIENVERNHKFVSKMSDEQLNAAHYIWEAKGILKKAEKQLKEVKTTKENYDKVEKIVMDKFGFVETTLPENEVIKKDDEQDKQD